MTSFEGMNEYKYTN